MPVLKWKNKIEKAVANIGTVEFSKLTGGSKYFEKDLIFNGNKNEI